MPFASLLVLGLACSATSAPLATAGATISCMATDDGESVNTDELPGSVAFVQTKRKLLTARREDSPLDAPGAVVPVTGPFADRKVCRNAAGIAETGLAVQCYPDVMFAGCSKCGSSSVAMYMLSHPQVIMEAKSPSEGWTVPDGADGEKLAFFEVHIFDNHKKSNASIASLLWERSQVVPAALAGNVLQVEYTPNYIYHPDTPFNILDVYPNARSIRYLVMLREPTLRAISGWKFHLSHDKRSFKQVVDDGIAQRRALEACYMELLVDHRPNSTLEASLLVSELPVEHHRDVVMRCFWGRPDTHDQWMNLPYEGDFNSFFAHVDKGVYIDQVRRWFSLLGRQNFFILSLEQWEADTVEMYEKLAHFAGYEAMGPSGFRTAAELEAVLAVRWNEGSDDQVPDIDPADQQRLQDFYIPYTEMLFEFLGSRLW